jgi:hypothetical protein
MQVMWISPLFRASTAPCCSGRPGFQALTDPWDVSYLIHRAHDPTEDVSIAFDDPELAIPWRFR